LDGALLSEEAVSSLELSVLVVLFELEELFELDELEELLELFELEELLELDESSLEEVFFLTLYVSVEMSKSSLDPLPYGLTAAPL
jgi:hypothetical protein